MGARIASGCTSRYAAQRDGDDVFAMLTVRGLGAPPSSSAARACARHRCTSSTFCHASSALKPLIDAASAEARPQPPSPLDDRSCCHPRPPPIPCRHTHCPNISHAHVPGRLRVGSERRSLRHERRRGPRQQEAIVKLDIPGTPVPLRVSRTARLPRPRSSLPLARCLRSTTSSLPSKLLDLEG